MLLNDGFLDFTRLNKEGLIMSLNPDSLIGKELKMNG